MTKDREKLIDDIDKTLASPSHRPLYSHYSMLRRARDVIQEQAKALTEWESSPSADEVINKLHRQALERENYIKQLEEKNGELDSRVTSSFQKIRELENTLQVDTSSGEVKTSLGVGQVVIDTGDLRNTRIHALEATVRILTGDLGKRDRRIMQLEEDNQDQDRRLEERDKQNLRLNDLLRISRQNVRGLQKRYNELLFSDKRLVDAPGWVMHCACSSCTACTPLPGSP